MTATTPKLALPYPVPADTADIPRDIKALAEKLDPLVATVGQVGMTKLAEVVLASPAATIDLAAIPQTHTHLLAIASLRSTNAAESNASNLRCNDDATASYYYGMVRGNNGTVAMSVGLGGTNAALFGIPANTAPAGVDTFNAGALLIPNYRGSQFKMMIALNAVILGGDASRVYIDQVTALWMKAAAITKLSFDGNLATRSRITLYGLGS
jgi:hypothetical protein